MFTVTLKEIAEEFTLESINQCDNLEEILITTSDVNRPGLQLTGYYEFFGNDRIQIIGKVETTYLERMTSAERYTRFDEFFCKRYSLYHSSKRT